MPFINIKITPGATEEQRAELIKGATDLMVNVLGKNPERTVVVIEDVPFDSWGIGGTSIAEQRRQAGLDK